MVTMNTKSSLVRLGFVHIVVFVNIVMGRKARES
jgi:hypothetical protein